MGNALAIYIGTENIDVVSLAGSFQRPQLASFARVKLPEKSSWREKVRVEGAGAEGQFSGATPVPVDGADQEFIDRSVQSMLSKLGVAANAPIFASIASESVVIRCFQMPAIPAHERKMAIAFEAKKYLPFKLEELVTDYQVVIRRSDPTLMRVMFFGVKKSSIAVYASLFQYCKLLPYCLEPAPISLMRLVRQNGQLPAGQVVALLSMEHDAATISVARDDLLYLSRNVTILPTPETPDEASPELLEALLNETRVSIDYYRRRFLGEPAVSKIILFGSIEDPKKIEELFKSLELPVELGDPFKKLGGAKTVPGSFLSVSVGLALRGLDNRTGGINLLPSDQRRASQGVLKPLIFQAVAAVVALGIWYSASISDLRGLEKKIANFQSQQIKIENVQPNLGLDELRELRSQSLREKNCLTALADLKIRPSSLLVELARTMPEEAWLQYVVLRNRTEIDPKKSTVPGRRAILRLVGSAFANNREMELEKINRFLAALQKNPVFKTAFSKFSLDSVQRESFQKEEVTEFHLTCASSAEDMNLLANESRGSSGRRSRP
ncbi:MAG: pilus assembly protein PilM [Candidatus Omnitrophota bacterium]|nr:pilus assembly protein PilM [Candidatus Omnitrophota bacterium]